MQTLINLLYRLQRPVCAKGILSAVGKVSALPSRILNKIQRESSEWRFHHSRNARTIFQAVYKINKWGNDESFSGPGSTLEYTTNLRQQLRVLFREYSINKVFDGPCGDFNWMKDLLASSDIHYLGGDIVPEIIKKNSISHSANTIHFSVFDITRDKFPEADLWICRDCLFHLSYAEIYSVLENFSKSNIPLALLTNHKNTGSFANCNIRTGGFRRLDLLAPPFNLPHQVKFRIVEGLPMESGHEMCLWNKRQIEEILPGFKRRLEEQGELSS